MKTDGTVPKEGDETMNQDHLDCSSDVEMIDECPDQFKQQGVIELSDEDVDNNLDDSIHVHEDDDAKIKELEKRLQSELNLRMGHIGYHYGEDEDENRNDDDEEQKIQFSKKKATMKKKSVKNEQRGSDGKLK